MKWTTSLLIIAIPIWPLVQSVNAEEPTKKYELNIRPEQCAVLEEGDNCYVNVKLTWKAEEFGSYCITQVNKSDIVQCWESSQVGTLAKKYVLKQSMDFYLISQETGEALAKKRLQVSWVYKKRSRSLLNWRIF